MRVEEKISVAGPPEKVWQLVTDPDQQMRFVHGITRWDVEGRKRTGLGARYSMRMRVGSAEVGSLVEVVEFVEPEDMAWSSVTGLDQRGRWRLRKRDDGGTDVTLRIAYQSPGGLLGTLADRFSAPLVHENLRRSLDRLKRIVEGERMSTSDSTTGTGPVGIMKDAAIAARVFARAGLIRPERPSKIVRSLLELQRWGRSPAAGYAAAAHRYPHEPAIIDEGGVLTFADVHRRTNRLAHALSDSGVLEDQGVAIMCRNHRGFVEAVIACSKLGAHALLLNTSFAGPQLTEVVQREKPVAVIYDEEFAELLEDAGKRRKRFVAWQESDDPPDPTLEDLIGRGDDAEVVPPAEPGRTIILTSGTTGTPKGANRASPDSLQPGVSILSVIPLKAREPWLVAAPLFHSWGFAHFTLGLIMSATLVLQRRFDPEETLAGIERHRATSAPMVPIMLARILDLGDDVIDRYDTSSLCAVPVSGSALPGDLAVRFMDRFGDVIYNLYGSTEVAWATIAAPRDLREAPGTSGPPPVGTVLRIYDENGVEVRQGETGRIFVGNDMLFEGYTGGEETKEQIDGLMATGDVGHLDERGRLFVEGRDDDMIVSGGENVFPQEVEDLLARHKDVKDAAVIGVEDEEWGQRLKAFVVKSGKVSANDIKSYVKENLARYKVPREVEFLDELPRNPTGKVLKRELAQRGEDGAKPSRRRRRSGRSSKAGADGAKGGSKGSGRAGRRKAGSRS
jgi:acyl-CoA synthetase (AMP-forming)/AMP-acid ligase II/uncharacterized membrane protein